MLTLETKALRYSLKYKSDGSCCRVGGWAREIYLDVGIGPRSDVEISSRALTGVCDDKRWLCGQDSRQL